MRPFSTLRLTLLRACYAVLVVGLSLRYAPNFAEGLYNLPRMDGIVVTLLSAMGILAIAGLFSPIRMLPLLIFEIAWKLLWVATVALPKAFEGALDQGTLTTLFNCAVALPFVIVVPWRFVVSAYVGSVEPWRTDVHASHSASGSGQ